MRPVVPIVVATALTSDGLGAWSIARLRSSARFGGYIWVRLLLALGDMPRRLVQIVQDVVNEKIRQEGGRQPDRDRNRLPPPRLSQRALAAAQGQEVGPVLGVQHRISMAKQAREQARLAAKHLERDAARWKAEAAKHPEMWRRDHSWQAWEAQKRRVDELWENAERLSQQAGHPYTNRDGQKVGVRPDMSIVNLALRRYEQEIATS